MSEKLIKFKLESSKFKAIHNGEEWTPGLDETLKKSVLSNCFNFNIVSLEVNDEADRQGVRFGIANAYTNEKCRIRWFYLHCTRALEIKRDEESKIIENKENSIPVKTVKQPVYQHNFPERRFKEDEKPPAQVIPVKNVLKFKTTTTITPKKSKPVEINEKPVPLDSINSNSQKEKLKNQIEEPLAEEKSENPQGPRELWENKEMREDFKESQTYAEAEKYQWRQNLAPNRNNKDYLDVSNENFSNYKTVDIEGNEITPSTFNIFRDSFKKTFTEMRDTLKNNLPDLNLEDTTESDDNEEVVPLDFRTKLMEGGGDVVMQAKPLKIYKSDEDDEELLGDIIKKSSQNPDSKMLQMSTEDFLRQHKKEAFDDNDENVILIQPNTNILEKLEEIDLE